MARPTSDDMMNVIMKELELGFTKKHQPFTESQQRKAVDLRRAMREVRRLQKELEDELDGTSIKADIVTFFARSRDE